MASLKLKGHTKSRNRKQAGLAKFWPWFALAMLVLLYYVMIPDTVYSSLIGESSGHQLNAESMLRLERVPPNKWTEKDVATWLSSLGLSNLRGTFRKNDITGERLLRLDERALIRELFIEDDAAVSRLLQEIQMLKHILASARRWDAAKAPSNAQLQGGSRSVKVFGVGRSMLVDAATGKASDQGAEPDLVLSTDGVLDLRTLMARASKQLRKPVREFVCQNGDPIPSLQHLPDRVFALVDQDYYAFPVEYVGFKQQVPLPSAQRAVEVETLSTSPRVFLVEDFLSSEECERVVRLAAANMKRSSMEQMGDVGDQHWQSNVRTSTTAWIERDSDPLMERVSERVADLVKLPMRLAEDLQVLHYAKGQHYWAHHDYFDPSIYRGHAEETLPGQNRFITVFFYLTDVARGGETAFPFANGDDRVMKDMSDCSRGLRVKPRAGSAIFFYHLLPEKQQELCPPENPGCNLDVRSLHLGCDVIEGDKWAANYWISNKH